nr:MAG TPA: PalH/RIM21 [Bacteriophage sp.]
MWQRLRLLFIAVLTQSVIACSHQCVTVHYDFCPVYPIAGASVAAELENLTADEYPNTWEWIGRIDKLRQELELCKEKN